MAVQRGQSQRIYDYLERLSNFLRAESRNLGNDYGLQPVQLQALYYLSICNRYSNTPSGLTEYLGSTKGTVSQTIIVLENKGYILKLPNAADKRVVHLQLTAEGEDIVRKAVPPASLDAACTAMNETERRQLEAALANLLLALQQSNQKASFGVCRTCRFCQDADAGGFICGLTKEPLSAAEIQLICREHERP